MNAHTRHTGPTRTYTRGEREGTSKNEDACGLKRPFWHVNAGSKNEDACAFEWQEWQQQAANRYL